MNFKVIDDGLAFENKMVQLRFATRLSPVDDTAITLKQTHSDICHYISKESERGVSGDALWTDKMSLTLGVFTADCVPVLGVSESKGLIFAAHAGWRGVENQILPKLLSQLPGGSCEDIKIWLGPHIQYASLEFELPAARDLVKRALSKDTEEFYTQNRLGHCKLNLAGILKQQLMQSGVSPVNINLLFDDTFTDPQFHSYRRDQQKAGRQLSTIQLI